ncbi:unnamed protein product, partial [Staurois parvus]
MVRRLLGHMTGPRRRRTNHKAQRFSYMHTGHQAVSQVPTLKGGQLCGSQQSSPVLSTVSGHLLYCPQSLVISCTVRSLSS